MPTDTAIEIVSPLNHRDTDCVCRTARIPGVVATCAGCGQTVSSNVHLPLIAYGMFCSRCCPCTTFVPTPEEVRALRLNRARCLQAGASEDDAVEAVTQAERRTALREHQAQTSRKRWEDPAFREKMSAARTARWHDPAFRAAHKARLNDPVVRAKMLTHLRALNDMKRAQALAG